MKKYLRDLASDLLPYIITMILVLFCGKLFGGTPRLNPATPRTVDGHLEWNGDITWHKKIQTGSDSVYAYGATEAALIGARDTLYSDCFRNKDVISIQPVLSGGTTVRVRVIIQTANQGSSYPAALNDTLFANTYWAHTGTGASNCYVSTSADSILNTIQCSPINVPALGCGLFRIAVTTSGEQSGNTAVRIAAILKEE